MISRIDNESNQILCRALKLPHLPIIIIYLLSLKRHILLFSGDQDALRGGPPLLLVLAAVASLPLPCPHQSRNQPVSSYHMLQIDPSSPLPTSFAAFANHVANHCKKPTYLVQTMVLNVTSLTLLWK